MENSQAMTGDMEGSPESWKLFVGQIPRTMRHEEVVAQFSHFGEIQEVFIIRDANTGNSKGCCFVRYKSRASAELCIQMLNDKVVLPGAIHPLQVSYANQSLSNSNRLSRAGTSEGETKLFVGQLPQNLQDSDLANMFEPYGTVREAFIMRHHETGISKGAGFVRLEADVANVQKAITDLNGKIFEGSIAPIKVDFAHQRSSPMNTQRSMSIGMMPGRYSMHAPMLAYPAAAPWYQLPLHMPPRRTNSFPKLFVGGLTTHTSEAQLLQIFSHYGHVREVFILRDQSGQSKSSGFVKFATEDEANLAVASLSNRYSLPGSARPLSVRFANNPPENKLFVGYLPPQYDEAQTEQMFKPFGEVLEVHIMRDMRGVTKGSAFVKFTERAHAEAAILALHGSTSYGEKPLKVSFAQPKALHPTLMGQPPLLQQLTIDPNMNQHMLSQQQQTGSPQHQQSSEGSGGDMSAHEQMQIQYAYYSPVHQYFPVPATSDSTAQQLPLSF
jgi:CUG-BP- and ETR3-like factor